MCYSLPTSRYELIPAGPFDLLSAPANCASQAAPPPAFTVLAAAGLLPLKDFKVVVAAFASFYQALPAGEQPGVCLLLAGSDPTELGFSHWLQAYQVADCAVHCLPPAPREWHSRYGEASVFFLPSSEKTGADHFILEALRAGVPVLCHRKGRPGKLAPAPSSLKVPCRRFAQNVADFAELLRWLHDSPPLLAAEAGLARRHGNEYRSLEILRPTATPAPTTSWQLA